MKQDNRLQYRTLTFCKEIHITILKICDIYYLLISILIYKNLNLSIKF